MFDRILNKFGLLSVLTSFLYKSNRLVTLETIQLDYLCTTKTD